MLKAIIQFKLLIRNSQAWVNRKTWQSNFWITLACIRLLTATLYINN